MQTKKRLAALAIALSIGSVAAYADAQITNGAGVGSVALGVGTFGNLNIGSGITVNGSFGALGIAINLAATTAFGGHVAGLYDATSPGCLCEGWGVAYNGSVSGHSGVDSGGVGVNLTSDSFTSTASSAVSSVHLTSNPGLTVKQDYHAAGAGTFEDTVTITNNTGATINNLLYRRVMDWDVPYTEFTEAVTIQGWPATALLHTTDNGFDTADPLSGGTSPIACPVNANFTDCSPSSDHGALFDFNFGSLANGASLTFKVFYGAALSEAGALAELAAAGAEVYSLGQSDSTGGSPTAGTPATYFFGFAGVGGTPVSGVPEPSSILLLGVPAIFLARNLKNKFRKA
jgi:type IV pilus assembly protein PilY1